MATQNDELKLELSVFEQHKREWLRSNPGEFVVITGTRVTGFYADYESAFRAGLSAGITGSFLVKQVWAEEPVYLIYWSLSLEMVTEREFATPPGASHRDPDQRHTAGTGRRPGCRSRVPRIGGPSFNRHRGRADDN